jgi:hypothetical protein
MAKQQGHSFTPDQMNTVPGFKAFTQANQAALGAMTHIGVESMRQMIEMNKQYLDFIRHRLDEDIKTGERIGDSKSVPDAMAAVSEFYSKAFEEYSNEMVSLSEMATKAASETLQEAERATKDAS